MGRILLAILALSAIGSLMSSVTLVRSDELAVVRRFGRILPDRPRPGLLIGLPWGMDKVSRVSRKDRTVTVGWTDAEPDENSVSMPPGQLLTGDHNLVNVQAVIEYRVIPDQVDRYVLMEDRIEPLLARAAEAAMTEWLAGQKVDDAILKKQQESHLMDRIVQWIEPYQLGVQIDRASITRIEPPSEVRKFFSEVSEAHAGQRTQITAAEQFETMSRRKADEDVYRIKRETNAYVGEQKLSAQAEAASFKTRRDQYELLRKGNPQFLNDLWLDEVTRMFGQLSRSGRIDVLDHYLGSDGLNITQFPLQKK